MYSRPWGTIRRSAFDARTHRAYEAGEGGPLGCSLCACGSAGADGEGSDGRCTRGAGLVSRARKPVVSGYSVYHASNIRSMHGDEQNALARCV